MTFYVNVLCIRHKKGLESVLKIGFSLVSWCYRIRSEILAGLSELMFVYYVDKFVFFRVAIPWSCLGMGIAFWMIHTPSTCSEGIKVFITTN